MADEPKKAAPAEAEAPKKEKKEKRKKGDAGPQRKLAAEDVKGPPPSLREKYKKECVPALMKELGFKNPMQVPRLQKVVVNMGLGEALTNNKMIDASVDQLMSITGQKPVVTRARKAIANFKLRAGQPIGAMVTLRNERMWEFLDRLMNMALPRVRDFKGVSPKAFAARRGKYGSRRLSRACSTTSAAPSAITATACAGSSIMPTAPVAMSASRRICAANGTW